MTQIDFNKFLTVCCGCRNKEFDIEQFAEIVQTEENDSLRRCTPCAVAEEVSLPAVPPKKEEGGGR